MKVQNAMFAAIAALCVAAMALPAKAALVAKWDFDNYDPENPTSAAVLAPTVGSLAMIPCTGTTESTEVTDGTLGAISVINVGLPQGDYALSIPNGAHLKVPLPAGIVHDKNWMLRLRFNSPGSSAGKLRTLVGAKLDNPASGLWYISGNNLIQGSEGLFGTAFEENQNTVGKGGKQGNNGAKAFRLVSSDAWHSFTAVFGSTGASSTLDGYRSVSRTNTDDIRSEFTGDGFILCGGNNGLLTYIASVEVWDDVPIYHYNGYIKTSSTLAFPGCSLNDIRDLYLCAKGCGTWGDYARVISSTEHIVTTDGDGNVTDLKLGLRNKLGDGVILCEFANADADVNARTLRMQWGLAWPNPYFTSDGGFVTDTNSQAAPASWDGNGYSAYNLYALPFRPLNGNASWSVQMGRGKFGNPVLTVAGDNPILIFDIAPEAESLTLDCSRGTGRAGVTFAYTMSELKDMTSLGGLNVGEGLALTIPAGVSVSGPVTFGRNATVLFDAQGAAYFENGQTLLTATGGIALPEGAELGDVAAVSVGTVEFADGDTKIVYKAPPEDAPITATWIGGGDRAVVTDPQNWMCWNYRGVLLEGAVPNEYTTITVTGSTTFNFPAGQTLTYRALSIGSCSLTEDCDWSGIGAYPPFVANAVVDMNGHNLKVGGLGSESAATISNEVEGEPSELCVSAATDSVNTKVLISGNVKFVKDGVAKYTSAKGQTYTGGNELLGGMVSASLNATQQKTMGATGNEILVRAGATLQLEGQVWYTLYPIVLDGGTIQSAFSEALGSYSGGAIVGSVRLLSDSVYRTVGNGNLRMWGGHLIDLGGHTLSVDLADSTAMLFCSDVESATSITTISNGTFSVTGGTFRPYNYPGVIDATTATMRMDCAITLPDMTTLNVRDYEALYEGEENAGAGEMNVYGRFKPVADGFYGCKLQNGAVLDLNARRGTWSTTSSFTTGSNVATFAEGARVTVDLSGRDDLLNMLRNDEYVVTWAEPPADDVVFSIDAETASRALSLARGENGLKLISTGIMIIVR